MADKAWKAFERAIAAVFGGVRRGADFRRREGGGKSDVIHDNWSIECKLSARPTYSLIYGACLQAERQAEHEFQCPVAVVKKTRVPMRNALVVMRLETFREWFIGGMVREVADPFPPELEEDQNDEMTPGVDS